MKKSIISFALVAVAGLSGCAAQLQDVREPFNAENDFGSWSGTIEYTKADRQISSFVSVNTKGEAGDIYFTCQQIADNTLAGLKHGGNSLVRHTDTWKSETRIHYTNGDDRACQTFVDKRTGKATVTFDSGLSNAQQRPATPRRSGTPEGNQGNGTSRNNHQVNQTAARVTKCRTIASSQC
ncbi:hypothetical protein [Vibrio fluvialis]|uniref:hypothetical protein n=1 Tax=Vibrio fluvialis TaxID=676 RepID=UPI001EEA7394|nr:hypothetical protein [Vibrio fluvialis]MCG6369057.1 hypothetical protein [Vibrio fluvialis]MCG6376224.1 hypothetical protein [Vibrio fluvialis]